MSSTELQRAIGTVLKNRRTRLKLTQEEVCRDIPHYHYSNLSKVEAGQQLAAVDKLEKICGVLGLTVAELYQMAENRLPGGGRDPDVVPPPTPRDAQIPYYDGLTLFPGESVGAPKASVDSLHVPLSILTQAGVDPAQAFCFRTPCNNLAPLIPRDAIVGINTAETDIVGGKLYALNHAGMLRLAVCYPIPGDGLRLAHYNTAEYPEERYTADQVAEHLRILGRAFWFSALV